MFSEYASKFLAQSQSRISFRQPEETHPRNPLERPRRQDQAASRTANRYLGAGARSGFAQHFAFGSRSNAAQAPLFYSGADDFREEDDEQEHEREVADFYALQRSRRQFVHSRPLEESSEVEDDASRASGTQASDDGRDLDRRGQAHGIRSSWTGDKRTQEGRRPVPPIREVADHGLQREASDESDPNQMYDVGLDSIVKSRAELHDDEPPNDLTVEIPDDDPPSVQHFRKLRDPLSPYMPQETDIETRRLQPAIPESDTSSIPPTVGPTATEPPYHDAFWGSMYVIAMVGMFASFVLVWLHTAPPAAGKPLKDTIYSTLHASYHLLAIDTVLAVIVALFWLALLRNYVRPFIYTILIAVPVIMFSFTLYAFVSSFQHVPEDRGRFQDTVMRWFSTLPGIMGALWVYGVYKGRHSFGKAIGILEFACKILAANPALLLLGFGTLGGVVVWTWIWMGMFTRIFLSGHMSTSGPLYFIIDVGSWWLGMFFVLMYLWTLGVGSGIQRATTAATVSQWYFHRLAVPAPSSGQVVTAALTHAGTTLFGTISLSSLLTLLVRLPVLVLPKRFMAFVGFCSYTLLPNSILILTHPTTLTYAAIHSRSLAASAHAVSQLAFMNPRGRFRNTDRRAPRTSSILPYNLALLLLHSTRLIAAMTFGFGAWVNTAHRVRVDGSRVGGSIYGYIVGLIAAAIGWAVLGAMESVLTGIVDAVVICWASEVRNGEVRYCREAGALLGDGELYDDEEATARGRNEEEEEEGLMRG